MKLIRSTLLATTAVLLTVTAHAATNTVTNTLDDGPGSLRAALSNALDSAGLDLIRFNIDALTDPGCDPVTGVCTIKPLSNLGFAFEVIIDGYSQPGATPNTLTNGDNAQLKIVINGSLMTGFNLDGLRVSGTGNTIKGLVINQCPRHGIRVFAGANGGPHTIEGCFIGTDVTGTNALGNGSLGIYIDDGTFATIGGTNPAQRNVISGNGIIGIQLQDVGHVVQGNYIGVDATGTRDLGNGDSGLVLDANNCLIGSTNNPAAGRNVISGNNNDGVDVFFGRTNNLIVGNYIGTDVTGTNLIGNTFHNISIDFGDRNFVGGLCAGCGNIIAGSGEDGVFVWGGEANPGFTNGIGNAILGNSIFSNGGSVTNEVHLGIELFSESPGGVTTNDICDTDLIGGNFFQNFPVLNLATGSVSSVTIQGTLNSAPNTTFLLEFFSNTACDPSGFGQGKVFLGRTNVTTDASCNRNFSVTFPTNVPDGQFITATATDPGNNTSEFSACIQLQSVTAPICVLTPAADTNEVGAVHTVTASVTTNGTPVSGVTVHFNVTAGPNTGDAAMVDTGVSGSAEFMYTGDGGVGTDTIMATGTVSGASFSCSATKLWTEPPAPPTISCPANIVTNNTQNQCSRSVAFSTPATGTPTPTVTCKTNSTVVTSPVTFPVGTTAVSCTASNIAGMMTCFFDVTVNDAQLPTIGCPSAIVTNVPEGQSSAVVNYGAPTSSDNCPGLTTNCAPASGTSFSLGTTTVTCTATDASSNSSTCTFTVTVNTIATNNNPVAMCTDVGTIANASCVGTVPASEANNGSFDPDGDPITLSLDPPGPYALGMTTVTLIVADNRGGTNTCMATITVNDTTPPTVSCPGTVTTNVPSGTTSAIVNYTTPTPTDNCPGANAVCAPASGMTFPVGTTPVTCTATDGSGNTAQCSFNVTVNELPPEAHDFAIISLKAPKNINLKAADPALTKKVKVQIQNRSAHDETIPDLATLAELVTVTLESLGKNCSAPPAILIAGPPNNVPRTLKPKQKLNVQFDVTYTCANFPEKGVPDFRYTAHVNHAALGTGADTHIADDDCPRQPLPGGVDPNPDPDKPLKDKGCAGGEDVTTDVVLKQ